MPLKEDDSVEPRLIFINWKFEMLLRGGGGSKLPAVLVAVYMFSSTV